MKNSDEMDFMSPFPRPFLMNALQFLPAFEISAAKQKNIVLMNLNYLKNCAQEEINLINGLMAEIEDMESKG
jgi:hypothetical protein